MFSAAVRKGLNYGLFFQSSNYFCLAAIVRALNIPHITALYFLFRIRLLFCKNQLYNSCFGYTSHLLLTCNPSITESSGNVAIVLVLKVFVSIHLLEQ